MTACLRGVRLLNARHASGASLRRHAASNKREGSTRTGERKQNSTRGSRRGSEFENFARKHGIKARASAPTHQRHSNSGEVLDREAERLAPIA